MTDSVLYCDFCNKFHTETKELIAGNQLESGKPIFICDQCVFLCVDILDKKGIKNDNKPR